jgi:hypothetical protein
MVELAGSSGAAKKKIGKLRQRPLVASKIRLQFDLDSSD